MCQISSAAQSADEVEFVWTVKASNRWPVAARNCPILRWCRSLEGLGWRGRKPDNEFCATRRSRPRHDISTVFMDNPAAEP